MRRRASLGSLDTETGSRLRLAVEVARRAGDRLRDGLGRARVEAKALLEVVTEHDRAAEAMIVEAIRQAFPRDAVLAEEGGSQPGGDFRWLIDPLDGTTNFAHGVPHFAISIGCQHQGALRFGVIYDPMRDELFRAEAGSGAYLNDHRLRVSATADLAASLLVTGFPYDLRQNPDNNLDHFVHLSRVARAVRRLGSAALDLAYVAAGRFDGYWELRLEPWDLAAGIVLVREAGGTVTRLDGGSDPFQPPTSIVASNGRIHLALRQALRVSSEA